MSYGCERCKEREREIAMLTEKLREATAVLNLMVRKMKRDAENDCQGQGPQSSE